MRVLGICLVSFTRAAGCSSSRARGNGNGNGLSDGGTPDLAPIVQMNQVVIATGAPANAPSLFGGPNDLASAPSLVYPPDGVLMPPNLNELEVQFTAAAGTTLFEIGFISPALALKIYTPCVPVGSGCGFEPDAMTWKALSDAGRGGPMQVTLRATSMSGGPVGSAAPRTISFTDEDLLGGLYYWAAASGAVNRYDFGLRGQKAESFYTPAQSGATCVGCHVLSRDGSRIAVGLNIPGPATLRLLDVATRTTLYESAGGPGASGGSNFEALSPDGAEVLANLGNDLGLYNAQTGAALGASPAIANATMPDWSADGARVVFARSGTSTPCFGGICPVNPGVDTASLFLSQVSGTSFGAPTQLVSGGASNNNYYPSFSPDGAFVAFNRSTQNSYDAPDAKVMVVPVSGGAPVDLGAVNAQAGNSWPKFAPFVQHYQGKTIFWLTFSSRRDYGLRLVNSAQSDPKNQIAQLWMVAVSPDRLSQAGDAGYPPFWLPFQDLSTGNHIAQWTQTVARQPCTPGPDEMCGVNEVCMNGVCVPQTIQ